MDPFNGAPQYIDVVIVGAGLSGIGAAYHLQSKTEKSYLIIEGRESIGGTWDLFRYPGIRSDSDMYTLGFSFAPWLGEKAIADGPSILKYVRDIASKYDIDSKIRFGHMVECAEWDSVSQEWTITCGLMTGGSTRIRCGFLFMCSGYYSYKGGYSPDFPGSDRFKGQVVHPQKWPRELDYAGKRVVVVGSGATAVTIVPEMAKTAAHVTMLQRSPTYIVSLPAVDPVALRIRRWLSFLPPSWSHYCIRWRKVLLQYLNFWLARWKPQKVKQALLAASRQELQGSGVDVDKHFSPSYNPWDQRLCVVPDSDLFKALKDGSASVVTAHIETFTETGIKLKDGQGELPADIIVSATGLNLETVGGSCIMVDGSEIDISKTFIYKGVMVSDVPNFALTMGYTNASWTLKLDLTCTYVCRVLNYMQRNGLRQCCPRTDRAGPSKDPSQKPLPLLDFSSGYITRSIHRFPKQGPSFPWKLNHNYFKDLWGCSFAPVVEKFMEFK